MGFESASWASVPAVALALAAISHASGASAYQSVDTLERLGRRLAYIDRNFENLLGSEQNMTRPATGGCTLEMPLQVISLPSRGDRWNLGGNFIILGTEEDYGGAGATEGN
eukprot:118567-Amorphochlora_amoeboformis.AAC.2